MKILPCTSQLCFAVHSALFTLPSSTTICRYFRFQCISQLFSFSPIFFFFLPFHLYDQDKQVILCNYIYVQKVDSAGAGKYTLFSTLDKTVKLGFFCFFGRGGGIWGGKWWATIHSRISHFKSQSPKQVCWWNSWMCINSKEGQIGDGLSGLIWIIGLVIYKIILKKKAKVHSTANQTQPTNSKTLCTLYACLFLFDQTTWWTPSS